MSQALRTLEAIALVGAVGAGIVLATLYAQDKLSPVKTAQKLKPSVPQERIEALLGPRPPLSARAELKSQHPATASSSTSALPPPSVVQPLPHAVNTISPLIFAKRVPIPSASVPIRSSWPYELEPNEKIGSSAAVVSQFADHTTSLYFPFGSAKLTASAAETLKLVVNAAEARPRSRVIVRAFTDGVGSACSNQSLAAKRARNVSDYLLAQGIKPKRTALFALGPQNSLESNATPNGRALNRRVEILLNN